MSKRLDGTSMFTGINAGLTNAFTQLSGQYSDGVTLENLNKALTNSNGLANNAINGPFASYMTSNFNAIDGNADGKISTDDIIKVIGNEFKPFIHSAGSIPIKIALDGDSKKQTLFAQALADKNNFITPVDYNELKDKTVSIQSIIDFKLKELIKTVM